MMPALSRLARAPAVTALALQILAFFPMLATVYLLARAGVAVSDSMVAVLQGLYAAGLTWWRRMASWWRHIQFLFPVALLLVQSWQLPPLVFLLGFLLLLGLYWSTFRTQVPYYPSGRRAWDLVAELLPKDRPVYVVDIGSGLGGFVLDLAARRPDAHCIGIELAPLPWLWSLLRARLSGSRARFVRGDYEHLQFSDYDLVFAYLSPAAMPALWQKARAEMRPGSMLLSYEFTIPGHPPDRILAGAGRGPELYLWNF